MQIYEDFPQKYCLKKKYKNVFNAIGAFLFVCLFVYLFFFKG